MAPSYWHSQLNLCQKVKHIPNNLSTCIGGTHFEMLAPCNPTKANHQHEKQKNTCSLEQFHVIF
jgi:hypothetical protein